MMQSCTLSMQVATCAVIVVYRQNKQAQITADLNRVSKNVGVVKMWHQGEKDVKVQGEKR